MKDQILRSTKNIIKFTNNNAESLICILKKKFGEKGESVYEKLVRTIKSVEKYSHSKNNDGGSNKIYDDLVLMYNVIKHLFENLKMDKCEKKIILTIAAYLYCVVKLICTIEKFTSEKTESCKKISESPEKKCSDKCESDDNNKSLYDCMENMCNDKKTLCDVTAKLKCILEMYKLVKLILLSLQKQFIEQINIASGFPKDYVMDKMDVDSTTKIMNIYLSQFESIIKSHCGKLFNDTSCNIDIKIMLKNQTELILCIIDNIIIKKTDHVQTEIDICNERITLFYNSIGGTYEEALEKVKLNITAVEKLNKIICNNQKIVCDCLATINNFVKYDIVKAD